MVCVVCVIVCVCVWCGVCVVYMCVCVCCMYVCVCVCVLALTTFLRPLTESIYLLYSPNTILVVKSRRMRGTGRVAGMGDRRGAYRVCWRDLMEKDHLEELRVDGRIILKWIFKKWDGETCVFLWLRKGTSGGHL